MARDMTDLNSPPFLNGILTFTHNGVPHTRIIEHYYELREKAKAAESKK